MVTDPDTEVAEVAGVRVPLGSHLSEMLRAKLLRGKYESREIRAVRSTLRADDVVLELGAGLGIMSVVCARIVGSQNVFAIEANPSLEGPIRRLYAANGVSPNLEICVLAEDLGSVTLHVADDFWQSSTVAAGNARHTVTVPKRRSVEVCATVRPTFLIVDIEGGELELVRHLKLDGIRTIVLELHPDLIGARGCEEVVARLQNARFRLDPAVSRKGVVVLHRRWSRDDLQARTRKWLAGLSRASYPRVMTRLSRRLMRWRDQRARNQRELQALTQGRLYGASLPVPESAPNAGDRPEPNPLEAHFDSNTTGPGLWKWRHYFAIYHRHFQRFVGQEVHLVEIGIYSGGSLSMWSSYFGSSCHIYGVDIEPACKTYERDGIDVFIGDQADPDFWADFLTKVPAIDIVIDDGGHRPHQQIATLKALLPHIRPGGVYLCEDIHGELHGFHSFVDGLTRRLSATSGVRSDANSAQQQIESVHHYPLVTVIEKPMNPPKPFEAPKHGTEWQPFL